MRDSIEEEGLIMASSAIRRAHRRIVEAATRGARVVLMGPSGSGKEGLARAYHRHSGREGTFVARNCSILSRDFLQSELFGAEEGAFTGAVKRIVGAVERAHGGTLFLDEIGEMAAEVQPMLLRFLDHGEYERMGNPGQTRRSDARIVCATNKNLRAASVRNEFRADLWYRLSIEVVEVPPLRERLEDVEVYLQSRPMAPGLSTFTALSPRALELVRGHRWEGNFRELSNFAERLPRTSVPGAIDEQACARALDEGALIATRPAVTADEGHLTHIAARALEAFAEDSRQPAPRDWNEVKQYLEHYLKPLLFASMGGITGASSRREVKAQEVAQRLGVDRCTALKQIHRYFERYLKSSG